MTEKTPVRRGRKPAEPNKDQAIAIDRMLRMKGKGITEIATELSGLIPGGITRQTIYNWKAGEPIQESHIPALCKYFNTTPNEIRYNKIELTDQDKIFAIKLVMERIDSANLHLTYEQTARIIVQSFRMLREYKAAFRENTTQQGVESILKSMIDGFITIGMFKDG